MKRIIGPRGTGKTKQLLEYAKQHNAIVLTATPERLAYKAREYGIFGLDIRPMTEAPNISVSANVVIHNVDFIDCGRGHLIGYTVIDEEDER